MMLFIIGLVIGLIIGFLITIACVARANDDKRADESLYNAINKKEDQDVTTRF